MRRRYRRPAKGRGKATGQAIVEFALTFMLVVILVLGMLELIFLMYAYNTLTDAAKEGVRYAIVHGSSSASQVQQKGVLPFANLSAQRPINVTVNYPGDPPLCPVGGQNPGCPVQVILAAPYHPLFGLGWPSVTINAAAAGRIVCSGAGGNTPCS